MTVLAFDGVTLAADKRASMGSTIYTTTKIFRVMNCLVGYAGEQAFGEQVLAWFKNGQRPEEFPQSQRDKEDWASLMVVKASGSVWIYERTPYPIFYQDKLVAIGRGRDYALAAMHCGKTAAEAVALTCLLDSSCGNGVDTLTFGQGG